MIRGFIDGSSLNASNLDSGTVPDARFPATLPAAKCGVTFNCHLNASNLAIQELYLMQDFQRHYLHSNGSALTDLNATALASGL
jgi:hypothetical protein